MLISRQRKFLFVHIQKTAGTSLVHALKQAFPDTQDFLRPHDPLRFAEQSLGGEYKDYFKVAFVRNPFERLVSWYTMITAHGVLLTEQQKKADPSYNKIWQYVLSRSNSFEEFVIHCSDATDRSAWKPFLYNQKDYLVNSNSEVDIDFIGRFETLDKDVARLSEDLGAQVSMPHLNPSAHRDYRQYYSAESRGVVERRFAADLDYFSYTF